MSFEGISAVDRILKEDVGVSGFELKLSQRGEKLAGLNGRVRDSRICNQLVVVLGDGHVRHGYAVLASDVIRAKKMHILVLFGQTEGYIWNNNPQRKSLDADFLIGIFPLGIQEAKNIWMVRMQVDGSSALPGAQLVGIAEAIFENLHDWDYAGSLVLNLFDRGSGFAQIAQQQGHSTTAL